MFGWERGNEYLVVIAHLCGSRLVVCLRWPTLINNLKHVFSVELVTLVLYVFVFICLLLCTIPVLVLWLGVYDCVLCCENN